MRRDIIIFCDTQGREHGALPRAEAIEKLERVASFGEEVSQLNFEFSALLIRGDECLPLANFLKNDTQLGRAVYIDQRTFRVWYRDDGGRGHLVNDDTK